MHKILTQIILDFKYLFIERLMRLEKIYYYIFYCHSNATKS